MSFEYEYTGLADVPLIQMILEEVAVSAMVANTIDDISVKGNDLKVWTPLELITGDKAILDAIVASSVGATLTPMCSDCIVREIFEQADPGAQLTRIINAFNSNPIIIFALENYDFTLARNTVSSLGSGGTLWPEDITLINGIIPVSKWVMSGGGSGG